MTGRGGAERPDPTGWPPPRGYQIGPARIRELAALPEIESAAAQRFSLEDLPETLRDEALSLAFLTQAARANRLWVARAIPSELPVGFAAAVLLDGTAHLHEMDVLPDHGGRGIGRALLARVVDWARDDGFHELTLTTFRHPPWNAPFYARAGFAEIPAAEIGPELQSALGAEAARGLDPRKRVVMRLSLHRGRR